MSSELFEKRKAFHKGLHSELAKHINKRVHCRGVDSGQVVMGAHGILVCVQDERGIRRYSVGDHNGNRVRFSVLELQQIIETDDNVLITVKKRGYSK